MPRPWWVAGPTAFELGNGVEAFADYQAQSGRLLNLAAYQGLTELQQLDYLFDVLGNLQSRHDQSGSLNLKETFSYDTLNRLGTVNLSVGGATAVTTLSLSYNAAGNITSKSDVGSYLYGGSQPHAVTSAGGVTYSYDLNGNQTDGNGRTLTYTLFDQAASITKGTKKTEFAYGIGNARYQRKDYTSNVLQKTTVYLGSVEYITEGASTVYKRTIGGVALADFYPSTGIQQTKYLLKDHLGSIHTVLNDTGQVVAREHFAAFGIRQDATNWQTPLNATQWASLNAMTTRGFTGHEHADDVGIIHMNGRSYDPVLGRFLQADPIVQAPKNSQSLNRYSYVFNNPLSYTDPSGYFSLSRFVKKWGRVIVAAVAAYFTYGWAANMAWSAMPSVAAGVSSSAAYTASAVIGGAAAGFVGGGIVSGSLKGATQGAFSGAILAGASELFRNSYSVGRVVSEGVAGGVAAEFEGRKFADGLLLMALVSSVTLANVRLREYELENSRGTPGQVGEGPGFRGSRGKLGGGRFEKELWDETGRVALEQGATLEEAVARYVEEFSKRGGTPSPLGCHQGGPGCIFGKPYKQGGMMDYIVAAYAGPHDYLNHAVYYNTQGTLNRLNGWQRYYGAFRNGANVIIATPIAVTAMMPDNLRFLMFSSED